MFTNAPTMRRFVPRTTVDGTPEETPELWEEETLDFQLNHVQITRSKDAEPYSGNLFITSKRVVFLGCDKTVAFDFDVPFITLHAVSRDPMTYPKSCIFCQLDCEEMDFDQPTNDSNDDGEMMEQNGADESSNPMENAEDDEEDEEWKELIIIPEEEKDIMAIFEALSHAALLNPDPEDDDEGNHDFIYNLDEVNLGLEQARMLDHLESVFQFPDQAEGGEEYEEEEDGEDESNTMDMTESS